MIRIRRGLLAALGGIALILVVSGCGSSSSSSTAASSSGTVKVDVGNGQTVSLPKGHLKIGILMNGESNKWQEDVASSAAAAVRAAGDTPTVLNANLDPTTQLNQLETAATNHSFNGIVILPVDGQAECNDLTKSLPQANVAVSVMNEIACGKQDSPTATGAWAPGTLNYVGGDGAQPFWKAWVEEAGKLNPGPQQVLFATGPQVAPSTLLQTNLIKQYAAAHPNFHLAGIVYTDFTTESAYGDTQNFLHAHPNTSLILSDYGPDLTRGVIEAIKSEGDAGKIKVDDWGGSQYTTAAIRSGAAQMTIPSFPVELAQAAVGSIISAQKGVPPARFVMGAPAKYGTVYSPVIISTANVASFKPEF